MDALDSAEDPIRPEAGWTIRRWLRLIGLSLALIVLIAVTALGLIWYRALTSSLAARWIRVHVYEELFAAYVVATALVPIGLAASLMIGLRARRHGNRRLATRSGRAFLTCLGLLAGICLCEAVCALQLRGLARLDHEPHVVILERDGRDRAGMADDLALDDRAVLVADRHQDVHQVAVVLPSSTDRSDRPSPARIRI